MKTGLPEPSTFLSNLSRKFFRTRFGREFGKWYPTILNTSLTKGALTAKSTADEECNAGLIFTSSSHGL